ncbi:MAG: N-acetylmuramoyl-L-alanine amidase [Bacteroidaceae bacterium]|nr:N-acetylmuramoyl-L-alanine amidase [Bacteroidaceae bacterium]
MKKLIFLLFLLFSLFMSAKPRPLVWVLDAGHGGNDQGTSLRETLEKDLTLSIVKEISTLLKKNKPGIKLILTRNDDRYLSLEERCNIANNANADLFLSIHINSAPNPLVSGTESFYADLKGSNNSVRNGSIVRNIDRSELLAWLLQKNYGETGRPNDRGARPKQLYVCQYTNMPAVLTEVGFLTNFQDAAYLTSKLGIRQISIDIYNALMEYYAITQEKAEKKSLLALRRTNGKDSGIKASKVKKETPIPVRDDPTPEEVERMVAEELAAKAPSKNIKVEPVIEQEKEETPEPEEQEEPEAAPEPTPVVPVFSIQLFAVSKEIKPDDVRLKGYKPVTFKRSGNLIKVLYGSETDYKLVKSTLVTVRQHFPDAFVVAYLGDVPISVADALKLVP